MIYNQTFIENATKKLNKFIESGGTVEKLKKGDPAYDYIKNAKVFDEAGQKLDLSEKFKLLGMDRKQKRVNNAVEEIVLKVKAFVAAGGDVQTLNTKDELYQYIKNANVKDEYGRKLNLEEKFAAAGINRQPVRSLDVKKDLIEAIELYLQDDKNSFHIERKQLPFYEKLLTYRRCLMRNGKELSTQQIMKDLGYKNYSDLFYRFKNLFKIEAFEEEEGFVDAYRSDSKVSGLFVSAAATLDLPEPLVVMLVMGKKLKKCYIQVDYFDYVKNNLLVYLNKYGTLKGISNINPPLYMQICHIKKCLSTGEDKNYSNKDVLNILGLKDAKNGFYAESTSAVDFNYTLEKIREIAQEKDCVSAKDLPDQYYRVMVGKAIRYGIGVEDMFKACGINYKSGRKLPRLNGVYVDKYPYIDQMQERKKQLLQQENLAGLCKEEAFEKTVAVALKVYDEFKDKIDAYQKQKGLSQDFDIKTK